MRGDKGDKGFTLIELLIVVIIVGVLAAIAVPIYLNVQVTAKDNTAKLSVTEAKSAVVAYYASNGSMPGSLSATTYITGSDVTMSYFSTGALFCVSGSYAGSSASPFVATSTSGTLRSGACASVSDAK